MTNITNQQGSEPLSGQSSNRRGAKLWVGIAAFAGVATCAIFFGPRLLGRSTVQAAPPSLPVVTVSEPLRRDLDSRLHFLGQFSPVERVELRSQVGGTLTKIGFKDGDVVRKGRSGSITGELTKHGCGH